MGLELYAHNREAYERAVEMMAGCGKAAVVHPTGTGKSFIGFELARRHAAARVLWLTPSEYIVRTQLENWEKAGAEACGNIQFVTYSKLMLLAEDELALLCPEYIVLDEFHRCGAEKWGQGVQRLLAAYPRAGLLGLSATNVRYLDNQRDMAQELFEGHIASYMTLGEAVVRGILPAPVYVSSVYSYRQSLGAYEEKVKAVRGAGQEAQSARSGGAAPRAGKGGRPAAHHSAPYPEQRGQVHLLLRGLCPYAQHDGGSAGMVRACGRRAPYLFGVYGCAGCQRGFPAVQSGQQRAFKAAVLHRHAERGHPCGGRRRRVHVPSHRVAHHL